MLFNCHREEIIVKLKEIIAIALAMIFANWFSFKMIHMYGSIISRLELRWIIGFFSGLVFAKLLIELQANYSVNLKARD